MIYYGHRKGDPMKQLHPLIQVAVDVAEMATNLVVVWETLTENSVEIFDANTGDTREIRVQP